MIHMRVQQRAFIQADPRWVPIRKHGERARAKSDNKSKKMQRLPLTKLSSLLRTHLSRSSSDAKLSTAARCDAARKASLLRRFSSISERDDVAIEEDVERKAGWLLKLFFVGTFGFVGYQFFPYMGDNLLQQSISLLHVKDPLFKRMGASRLSRFAIDDERRMKVVERGGALHLLTMLETAKDDKTRKEALKALVALSHSDLAAEALRQAGAIPIVSSTPNSGEYAEVDTYKSSLLKRFEELKPSDFPAGGAPN